MHPCILECILYPEFLALLKRLLLKSFSLFNWLPAFEFKKLEHQPFHRRRYVVKRNLITEVYLMNVMESNYMFRPVLAIIRLSMELKG